MKALSPLLALLIASAVFSLPSAHAGSPWPAQCQEGSLTVNDPRYPINQLILTCVPKNWSGKLVVYAHGYVPVQEPLSLPLDELTLADGLTLPGILLSNGFAFATSSYHKNGYAIEQAGNDLLDLVEHFEKDIASGQVNEIYIIGASEGGLVATMLLESHPEIFQAGLSLCGPVSGMPDQIKYLGDFRVIFDYFFPGVLPFGMNVPLDAYRDWEDIYVPNITEAIMSDSEATRQLFHVTHAARDPLQLKTSAAPSALDVLFFSVWEANDILDVAGGQPYGNQSTRYRGSRKDAALNAGVERIQSDSGAGAYIQQFYEPTGILKHPLVTLHNTWDDLVPFSHEVTYRKRVISAGYRQFLTVLVAPRYGHCEFTTRELSKAFNLMVRQRNEDRTRIP